MANQEIDNLALLSAPIGSDVYAVKTNTDYRVRVGEANGLATLDVIGTLTAGQLPTHTHAFSTITSKPTTLSGYGITDAATNTHTHTFASLTSKPTTLLGYGITDAQPAGSYALAAHTHTFASLTSKPTTLAGYGITNGALSTHNHNLDDLDNVVISAKANGEILKWNASAWVNNTLAEAGIAAASHTHTTSQVTGLDTALAGKAATSHTHTTANITGLDTALAGKAATSHTHTMSQITDAGTWATKNQTVSTAVASGTPADGAVWLQYTP